MACIVREEVIKFRCVFVIFRYKWWVKVIVRLLFKYCLMSEWLNFSYVKVLV